MKLEVTDGRFISEIQSDSNELNGKTKQNKTSISRCTVPWKRSRIKKGMHESAEKI